VPCGQLDFGKYQGCTLLAYIWISVQSCPTRNRIMQVNFVVTRSLRMSLVLAIIFNDMKNSLLYYYVYHCRNATNRRRRRSRRVPRRLGLYLTGLIQEGEGGRSRIVVLEVHLSDECILNNHAMTNCCISINIYIYIYIQITFRVTPNH